MNRLLPGMAVCIAIGLAAPLASLALPDADTLLADLGVSADEIAAVQSGKIVTLTQKASTERELVAAFAFKVATPAGELQKEMKGGLLASIDPNTISRGPIRGDASLDDFASLALTPNTDARVKAYLGAAPGEALNLSTDEIAAFGRAAAAGGDATAAVQQEVRQALLARHRAYRAKGLAGIASYDRGDGKSRSAGEDLRAATLESKGLQKYAPGFFAVLSGYPASKPPGLEETTSWIQFDAHGVPTIALVHGMFVPDGDAWVVAQRQFYVSTGFNCEQAVAAFLPVTDGTVVVYGNRTSTDQVTGFGGSAKRSIGSSLLASQLKGLFEKLQKK